MKIADQKQLNSVSGGFCPCYCYNPNCSYVGSATDGVQCGQICGSNGWWICKCPTDALKNYTLTKN